MILAVTHNAVDVWFVGLAALSIGCAVAAGALLANGWRRTPDPWAEAVAVERARIHGRKVRARRRRRAAAVRRVARRR